MKRIALILPFGAALLAGCTTPSLTLLPAEEGKQGAVAVLETDGRPRDMVVNELNSRTGLSGKPKTRPIDPARLSRQHLSLLDALPPAPVYRPLYFFEGSVRITPDSIPDLEFLKSEIARRPGADVQVTGYTDTVGSSDDNDELSQRRAEEILKVLAGEGIELSMLSAVGRGERELRIPTADNVEEPRNRRVVVTVR